MKTRQLLKKVTLSEEERNYLEKKIEKIDHKLGKKNSGETMCEVEIEKNKKGFWRVEIMIKTPRDLFRADKEDKDYMVAVDKTVNAIERQFLGE